jgi:hypothetical protein
VLLVSCGVLAGPAAAQQLKGTLKKIADTKTIRLGYLRDSVPFSYVDQNGEPSGYSIDLCKLLVEAIGAAVDRDLAIRWQPVTSQTRIEAVVSGQIDMECGSTTNNIERQKRVAGGLRGLQPVVADVFQLLRARAHVRELCRHHPGVDLHAYPLVRIAGGYSRCE